MGREGACVATEDGRFFIPEDYPARAMAVDVLRNGAALPAVRVLDPRPIDAQVAARARTYLDTLLEGRSEQFLSGPFGDSVSSALKERRVVLEDWGLGKEQPKGLSPSDVRALTTMEIQTVFETLGAEGKAVFMAGNEEAFAGIYAARVHLDRRPFAVIEGQHSITLVPWKPGLESGRGLMMSGIVQGGVTDFRVGLQAARGLGLEL